MSILGAAAGDASSSSHPPPTGILSRIAQDASNAFTDAYGALVLGDDAGKSARVTLVLHPPLNLGMTFLEINGRAYVRTVSSQSKAAAEGVLPRDSIQLARSCDPEWGDSYCKQHGLECEEKGMRTSYGELKSLLKIDHAFVGQPSQKYKGPPIPSTINVCAQVPRSANNQTVKDDDSIQSAYFNDRPIVLVLRRTRQRPSTSLVNFRLDDECDFASSLIRRLAPTADMEQPSPDTWEELVHDGTDWLLGNGSILPPKRETVGVKTKLPSGNNIIPLDNYEQERAAKLAKLRSRMAAESLQNEHIEDVEATTIRGMIQKAVGLAFVRASKVVLGISVHAGSGIVISRLADGTWSAPSAIGTLGLGLGIQFGLEVAEYIFILQTQESLEHFRRGGSFTIGGNIGAAIAGMGREAYGAASVGSMCAPVTLPEDEYTVEDRPKSSMAVAPIVAYAKSQGLYIGVSLEGSRIFTRDDLNTRAYKFAMGREVTAGDILSGKVATPHEAEDLYASLHSVEFTHEMSCLPRPPEVLRKDSPNSWYYDRSSLSQRSSRDPFSFLTDLSKEESDECASFEAQFKKFMYGGVSVQRLIPNSDSRSGKTRKERRTLWLMLPEIGALRLGFVSKLSDGDAPVSNPKSSTQLMNRSDGDYSVNGDLGTVASEEVTLDSALQEKGHIRTGVQLSNKHSLALTDVTILSQEANVPVRFNPDDQTEHLRVISIQDVSGTSLLFLANNFREAELLVCGLKLLLEQETARLGVRGGLPITALGGRTGEGAMSPAAARGFKEPNPVVAVSKKQRREHSGYSSSEREDDSIRAQELPMMQRRRVPEGRKSWGNVPGRNYMRGQAAGSRNMSSSSDIEYNSSARAGVSHGGIPKYIHGQLLVRDICTNVQLPLSLSFCRVLLLDSASPVISKWEQDRGDTNFRKTPWTFPPATPRELERHASEHQLIASGSMMGAHRTTSFDRPRNGSIVRLSETQIIDADDSEKLAFTVSERMPRRGFSIKVRVLLRAHKENSCQATVLAELRPVGKNMSNQGSVHKAFLLVLNEIKARYGAEGKGLIAGFMHVVTSMPGTGKKSGVSFSPFPRTEPHTKVTSSTGGSSQKLNKSGLVSLDEIMKKERMERPSTPSIMAQPDSKSKGKATTPSKPKNKYGDYPADEQPVTIEVKPLPKIRLSLMPAPREEDEEELSSEPKRSAVRKKKRSSSKTRRKPQSRHSTGKSNGYGM